MSIKIAVIGLGYVGLPLARLFATKYPVVGFDMGVVNNMVINGYNGYKAELKNSNDLALGIKIILELSKQEYQRYSDNSVKQVEEFSSFNALKKIKFHN